MDAQQKKLIEDYWHARLGDNPHGLSLGRGGDGPESTLRLNLSTGTAARLRTVSKGSPLGVAILGMALLKTALRSYAKSEDVTLVTLMPAGGPSAGNRIACRTRLGANLELAAALGAVKATVQEALAHGDYPYEALRERLRQRQTSLPEDDASALFRSAVLHSGLPTPAGIPLVFTLDDSGEDGAVSLVHRLAPAHVPLLERLLAAWAQLLAGFTAHLKTTLARLPVIPEAERRRILDLSASPASWPSEATVAQLFDQAVRSHGSRIAVTYEGRSLTYAELDARATRLAGKLRAAGAGRNQMVALLVDRSLELVTAILAVVKAGAAYVPIDPDLPAERMRFILEDCGARLVVASRPGAAELAPSAKWFHLDDPELWQGPVPELAPVNAPGDLLYVIYTSGTTGRPKGVLIEHRNVVRLLFNDRFQFSFGATDTWTLFHSYTFDFSVWEMYGALLYGGRVVVVPKMTARDPSAFVELMIRERVTVLNQTPSAFYGFIEAEQAQAGRVEALRYVIFGGEALDPGKLATWRRRYPEVALINMYGITETTVHVTYKEIGEKEIETNVSNIGRAIPTLSTYVVDEQLELAPLGVAGELCVGGEGVARGYLNRDELTAARFVASPFVPGEKLYRSGDLVRLLESGDLEYLGRIDAQVKVRGFRVETGEIETQLKTHPAVARAVVVARTDGGATYLCAYFELKEGMAAVDRSGLNDELRAHLGKFLPDYMVPQYFVAMERVPLTANGKLDRAALPSPLSMAAAPAAAPAAVPGATSPVEAKLRGIWDVVISAGNVAADRSFFDAGGDSIRAIRLVGLVNEAFGTQLRIPDLYQHDTLARLSALVSGSASATDENGERAALAAEFARLKEGVAAFADVKSLDDVYPATDIEQAMLYHGLKSPGEGVYHDQLVYEFSAPGFDAERFRRALVLLAGKHEVLRSRFVLDSPDGPLLLVEKHAPVVYGHLELASMDARQQSEAVRAWLAEDRTRPFVPEQAPLWRVQSFACGGGRLVLALVAHHAILDGWSASLFVRELDAIYRRLEVEPGFRPEPLSSRHREHVLQQLLERRRPEAAAFWREELQGFVPLDKFAEARRNEPHDVREMSRELPPTLVTAVRGAAKARGVSVKTLCLTAYLEAMSMFNYHADMVVGLVAHDRPTCVDGDRLLGCFLNTIPFRIRMPAEASWEELARTVEARLQAVRPYERLPLAEIIRVTGEDARGGNPFFSAFFNYTDFGDDGALTAGAERKIEAEGHVRTDMQLEFTVDTTGERLQLVVSHAQPAFTAEEAERLCTYFERALRLLVQEPGRRVSKLDVMGEEERQQVVVAFNATDRNVALGPSVPAAFAAQAARTPERVAVVWEEGQLTYAQLAARAERIAAVLRASGVKRETVVGLLVERSPDMVAAVLGIIAAGGAYLPFDPELPDGRIEEVLSSVGVKHLVSTTSALEGRKLEWLKEAGQSGEGRARTLLSLDRLETAPAAPVPTVESGPDDLLYLISTSGSTGNSKCVMVEHFTMLNLAEYTREKMGLPAVPKVLQLASIGFDVSAQEMFTTLLTGGQLHLIPPGVQRDVPRLLALLERRGVEVVYLTPALLDTFFADAEMAAAVPACVRHFIAAGEALMVGPLLAQAVREGRVTLHNHYGPSETHLVIAAAFGAGSEVAARPALGKPVSNFRIFVLDENGMSQPVGTPGEIYLGGRPVGRGYYGRDDLTAERYRRGLPDATMPASLLPEAARSERVYRSGDLGCWKPDGTVTYLGRIDQQVKIRGFRVELGEIEQRLRQLAGVKEAVVLDVDDGGGRRRLVAYVVPQEGKVSPEDASRWRAELGKTLPSYMVPPVFIGIEAVPLTGNGKVDRRRLRAVATTAAPAPRSVPLGDPLAVKLAELWASTLGVDAAKLGTDSDFFAQGGHSLKAMLLAARVQRAFGVALPLAAIYEEATLGAIAERIRAAALQRHEPIQALAPQARYRVSPAQQRFFVLSALAPETLAYNLPLAVELSGAVDAARLERALTALVARYAALRTGFFLEDGVLFQRIEDTVQVPFAVADVTASEVPQRITAFVRPFDLARPPLIRALLLRTGQEQATLALDFHHIALDGVSTGILLRDLLKLYAGETLTPPRLQYVDYVAWLETPAQQQRRQRLADFWSSRFTGETPVLNLPTDLPRPPVRTTAGALTHFTLPPAVVDGWRRLAREEGASLFMVSLAAFHVFLAKLTGQDRTVVGTPVAGRNHADLEDIVGVFVNTLALGNQLDARKSFRAFLADVRRTTLDAFEHQDYPFEELVERLGAARDTARNPLFDAFLALQNIDLSVPNSAGLKVTPRDTDVVASKFDLSLYLAERDGGLTATFEYASDLFRPETVARFARYFATLGLRIATGPDAPIGKLSLVDDEGRAFLDTLATSPVPRPQADAMTLPALLSAATARFGDRPAILSATGETLTYTSFDQRVTRLAAALTAKGVGRGSVVALRLERSVDFVVAVFGVLKAGGAYLPIDPKTPPDRTAFMLRDSGARLILGNDADPAFLLTSCETCGVRALVEQGGAPAASDSARPEDAAYLLYTSGSTGTPKAVVVEHRAIVNTILALQQAYPLEADGVYLHKTASTFDVSAAELFGWMHAGGRLALLEPGGERDPLAIVAAIARHNVTHLNFVPSMFGAWVEGLDATTAQRLGSLRHVFLAGEAAVPGPIEAFRSLCPAVRIHNLYGPTEAAIYASGFSLADWDGSGEIPIGKPLAGVTLRIIDHHGGLAPVGVVGELAIGGAGLARCYLNRPDLTAASFVPDTFGHGADGGRLYRTGDAARWRDDGQIEYRGRIDHQVKVRGFRVELGEVEAMMRRCKGIKDAVVAVRGATGGDASLCGYYVAEEDRAGPQLEEALRAGLAAALPDYMVPSHFVQLPTLPLNASGKVDRRALPAPQAVATGGDRPAYAAPSDRIEQAVAAAWARALGTERIGLDDNFFDLGGTSLGLVRLQSLLREALGREVPVATLFRFPTLRAQAAYLKEPAADRDTVRRTEPGDANRSKLVARRRRGS
ncbi:non-ribosomal peptide synthetase [Archangium lipolyticum]|uniref:non-ribosomal peptide synthetase n=1 Tax=Archangium lipolyticum TaxID=2970465 RepID=UPI00214A26D5|nr:non-ribosomal peptide synthetase [Archangium lipolyticum]